MEFVFFSLVDIVVTEISFDVSHRQYDDGWQVCINEIESSTGIYSQLLTVKPSFFRVCVM